MTPKPTALERALEEAVSRALRDNLAPLQRTADELHQAYADLVAACASTRPSNALPAMLRAQTAAAALSAGLSVLSDFVAVALNPSDSAAPAARAVPEPEAAAVPGVRPPRKAHGPAVSADAEAVAPALAVQGVDEHEIELISGPLSPQEPAVAQLAAATPTAAAGDEHIVEGFVEPPATEIQPFDIATLPAELQDLHRRANRVAKVAMQDIKLLRPKDVESGREHKDICERLRADLDKARKEYDRRFRAISDHPVDYFHHWMLEILAGGDSSALGHYPYPSAVIRH